MLASKKHFKSLSLLKRTPVATAVIMALSCSLLAPSAMAAVANPAVGDSVGNEFLVNTTIASNQQKASVAMDADGDLIIAWQSNHTFTDSDGYEIFAQRYDANLNALGSEFIVNTSKSGDQTDPEVAMDADGGFVITWVSDDGTLDIVVQRYNSDGTTTGSEIIVNTYTTDAQEAPKVAMNATGDFVITWMSNLQDGELYGIYAQRFNKDGTKAGNEFLVNSYTFDEQRYPDIAMNAKGDFVITWESRVQDGAGYGIFAQSYNADGTKQSSEVTVNTTTSGNQNNPSVAMALDGAFIVAWQSPYINVASKNVVSINNVVVTNDSIYAKRFTFAGAAVNKGEFLVNTHVASSKGRPTIAMDSQGRYIVAWESASLGASDDGVYAQRYDASDSQLGSEFLVNSYTNDAQSAPNIAVDSDGDFMIAWGSLGQENASGFVALGVAPVIANTGIYAQRYLGNSETVDLNVVVQDDVDPVTEGDNVTYSYIVTNNGSDTALDVNMTEAVPTGVTLVSDDSVAEGWSCTSSDGQEPQITCNTAFLAPGDTSTIDFIVTATTAGTLSREVSISASGQTDASSADNTDTETTVVEADPNASSESSGGGGAFSLLGLFLAAPILLRRKIKS